MTEPSEIRSRWWLALGASVAMTVACAPARQPTDPTVIGRLASTSQLTFAYELTPACSLEVAADEQASRIPSSWNKLAPNELANTQLTVVDRSTHSDERGMARLFRIRDGAGKTRWIRNVPAPNAAEVERRWSCAADADILARRVKPISATAVRFVPSAPSCAGVAPILGDAADVTFDPYTVLGRRLVRSSAGLVAAVTLSSAEGEHVLTLSSTELDSCFAATKRSPVPSGERESLATWLGDPSSPPPVAALPTYLQTVGLEEGVCLTEGSGGTRHDECRAAPFGVAPGAVGPHGLPSLRFFRERVTDAVHAYGGKLAPAEELAGINVHVRHVRGPSDGFGGGFSRTLLASMLDTAKQRARAHDGYRLLRASDVANGTTANATLDIDVTYAMPKLETLAQERRQKKVRGTTTAPNPAFGALARRVDAARAGVTRAEAESAAYQGLFAAPLPRCDGALPVACDVAARKDAGAARVAKRRSRLAALESSAKALPPTIAQDEVASVDYHAKVHRRHGEATITFKLAPTDALPGMALAQVTRKVAFDATEVEVIGDAAKGVEAKAARPPEQAQVDAAVAAAALEELDQLLAVWMHRATPSAPVAAFEPGSRAQLALFARWVASNRRVKLLSDLTEDRADMLASGRPVEYPIAIPEGVGRCYSFVATPTRPPVDVNLALRARDTGVLVGRDARAASVAAFEACPPPGRYLLQLSSPAGARAAPIAVGMFESTPGVAADPDHGAAMPPALGATPPRPPPSPSAAPPAPSGVPNLR